MNGIGHSNVALSDCTGTVEQAMYNFMLHAWPNSISASFAGGTSREAMLHYEFRGAFQTTSNPSVARACR